MKVISWWCLLAGLLQAQAPPAVKLDCAADGFVVNSVTGEPVPRAHLIVLPAQVTAVADSAGRFSFSNLICGRAQITASRPGFLMGGAGMPRGGTAFRLLTLISGSAVHDLKISLTPQAVVIGKVVDEMGDPVQGAMVNVMASQVMEGRRTFQISQSAQTNDLGEFRIPNLPAGRFIFCAIGTGGFNGVDAGNAATTPGLSCYPGPVEGGLASAMELQPGREARVDFTVSQVPAVHVRGTVVGMPKNQGASLTLQHRGTNRGRPARITPDGRFDVSGVTPGSYVLMTDYWESGGRLTARVPVNVGGADVDGVVVPLEAGFNLTGTVRVDSSTGMTFPPQQWALSLRTADSSSGSGQLKWNKDRTAFTFESMTPGIYLLGAGGPPAPFYVKSAMLGGRDLTREEVSIGQAGGPLEIVLSDDSGGLDGTVEDSAGQPTIAWVMLLQDGKPPRNVSSSLDGHFRMGGLPPGDYRVYAWDDFSQVEYADAEWMRSHGGGGQAVSVAAGQTGSVKLVVQAAGR